MTLLVATPGDPAGIGPEVVWKTIQSDLLKSRKTRLLCVGARAPFEKMGAPIIEYVPSAEPSQFPKKPFVWLLPAPEAAPRGKLLEGYQAGWSIKTAAKMVLSGQAAALITGPISKERLQLGGFHYPGHTEFLADLCGIKEVTMMLANSALRVSLVTTHLPLKKVSSALNRETLNRAIEHTIDSLRNWWGIPKPKIAVAALNPHAGESGLFGREEVDLISPVIESLKRKARGRFDLSGPFPSDTLFANHILGTHRVDAVVCMYHDQGLIPVKLLDFHKTVNVTLGLPIVRTSVDHGTAFDIAGKGIANPSSFASAVELALEISKARQKKG